MELYQTESHYILLDSEFSLWCNRNNGALEPKRGNDLCSAWNPVCIGLCYGIIGKIKLHPDSEWSLLLIKQRSLVGEMAGKHKIYKINKIAVLSLNSTDPPELELEFCKTHHFGIRKAEQISRPELLQKPLLKTWNTIKSAAENVKPKKREVKDKEKFEKRILEELLKMFNEEESFYYSETYDLTSDLQQQHSIDYDETLPIWKRCDNRFFWNKYMMQELIDFKSEEVGLPDHWIKPVVQGYIQMERCCMDFEENKTPGDSPDDYISSSIEPLEYDIWILSRRSRHRAGTRSKKRGLDETGACANYVVTEQIIEFSPHLVSFVQVRGSIPVYWSQTGIKYRPPPRLDKVTASVGVNIEYC
ncbi:phosphatidylinositide phosphatase SAC2 [Patella vulgata]|uniref:phosphatidylinositide phosphatase SAC2 n=1 Tax=Patella vulgata TaxID=6465 RepID=UPI0021806ADC|nr:phosphatidylinositide phosphatase SAC2 [Patella vulgata]